MKEHFKNNFSTSTDRNYDDLKKYFEHHLHYFPELESLRNEILNCLLLELYQSSIFSINHFLERILKLALIKKHTINLNYSEPELYNAKTIEAIKKYDDKKLFDTLKLAKEENLITEIEHTELDKFRNEIRNPYSHAEIKKIINKAPDKFVGFMFNISSVLDSLKNGEEIKPGKKTEITTLSSTFSQIYQATYSKEIALNYFKSIYIVLISIEKRLDEFKTST